MENSFHTFHIPVMGTGHSADTPLRVAPYGINSVVSTVDDLLLEKLRRYYSKEYDLPQFKIPAQEEDGRAKRIAAYLETVKEIVRIKFEAIRQQPFFANNDKKKYFDLLPDESLLKKGYLNLLGMQAGPDREELAAELTGRMRPGSIDINIMVKLDRMNYGSDGKLLDEEFSDAKAALRGFANSSLRGASVIFSAGINQSLFNYMTQFKDFYRDAMGELKKRIVLKVSDFRSALIQGKFLAKKGLEVFEFRIESGLNCGGHAFPSNGHLLPSLLQEFKEKRDQLVAQFQPLILKYYAKMGWEYPESAKLARPLITVQGGIGNNGEDRRLREVFGMDMTGWATPFLLVPEATCVDATTLDALQRAGEKELVVSEASPLNISFNNLTTSGSVVWTRKMAAAGKPGSSCPKGFLAFNTEFGERPLCLASSKYQTQKLREIEASDQDTERRSLLHDRVVEKECICHNLGNSILIALGLADEKNAPQAICPGPNLAWFNRLYSLREMVDHIYGRIPSLVPAHRPHMFAKEIVMYVDYFEKMVRESGLSPAELETLADYKTNLEAGMDLCERIGQAEPFPGENLASIQPCAAEQRQRLQRLYRDLQEKAARHAADAEGREPSSF